MLIKSCRIARLLCLAMLFPMFGCHENKNTGNTINYSTGISIENIHNIGLIMRPHEKPSIALINGSYVVNVVGNFDCSSAIDPFLIESSSNGSSLFLTPDLSSEQSDKDCRRIISLKISNRLKSGDIVYILDGYAVVGHVQVP